MNWDDRKALDADHVADPKPGDYWHEMFNGIALVIDTGDFFVAYLSKKKDVDRYHWTWDITQVEVKTRGEFKKMLSYGSIPGTWASVVPNSNGWRGFADAAISHREAAKEGA